MATVTENRERGISTLELVHCGMFATLMMIGANITAFVPFLVVGGVPITLQTFFAILAGLLLRKSIRRNLDDGLHVFRTCRRTYFCEIQWRFWRYC